MRALMLRAESGVGARIELSLAGMAHWLRAMAEQIGPVASPPDRNPAVDEIADELCEVDSTVGRITALRPALDVPWRPRQWAPPVRLGAHPPGWL